MFYFRIYNFSFKWQNLITYAGDGYRRFSVTLGISLPKTNKKYFFDFLLLKIFTGHNIEHFSIIDFHGHSNDGPTARIAL